MIRPSRRLATTTGPLVRPRPAPAAGVLLLGCLLLAACGQPLDEGSPSGSSTTALTSTTSVLTTVTRGPSGPASLAPPEPTDLLIEGTRTPYTFDETQAFGEFGPLLWGLVTTLNHTDSIPHGATYEWVDWGPLWGGQLPVSCPNEVFGVTDLSAVDVEAIAAVVPIGTTIAFREVPWSLDELEQFASDLYSAAPDNGVCTTGFGTWVNRVHVIATRNFDPGDVPLDPLALELFDECPEIRPAAEVIP